MTSTLKMNSLMAANSFLYEMTPIYMQTCDKFQRGTREVFLSFPGGFGKMYTIYKNILHSFQGDFKILVKGDIFKKNFMAHFLESPG